MSCQTLTLENLRDGVGNLNIISYRAPTDAKEGLGSRGGFFRYLMDTLPPS